MRKGFTLVELIVVVVIMVILLSLAGNMMKNAGKGQGLSIAVQMLEDTVREARLEAKSKSTWTRVVLVSAPGDTGPDSKNLRHLTILVKDVVALTDRRKASSGEWKVLDGGKSLPNGFYLSPHYSTLLKTGASSGGSLGRKASTFSQQLERMQLGPKSGPNAQPPTEVYFIEFDPQGRMTEPAMPTRLVIIQAMADPTLGWHDQGIKPSPVDADGNPKNAGGITIWPKGMISRIKSRDQIFD